MKKLIGSLQIVCMMCFGACAQSNNTMEYNGKTWEQLDGNGQIVTLQPSLAHFDDIEINGLNMTMKIETGATTQSVTVDVDSNLKDFIKISEQNGRLLFSLDLSGGKYSRWLSSSNIVIRVQTTSLRSVTNNSNSKIDIQLNNPSNFTLMQNGNTHFTLKGEVGVLRIESKGNSKLDASQLNAGNAIVSSNGNAEMILNAKQLQQKEMLGNNRIRNQFGQAQVQEVVPIEKSKVEFVSFQLKNNGILPYSATVITYRPDEEGNGTTGFTLAPYSKKSFRLPIGTKVYLANGEQVDVVMSGAKISDQTPFLLVKKEDEGQIIPLRK